MKKCGRQVNFLFFHRAQKLVPQMKPEQDIELPPNSTTTVLFVSHFTANGAQRARLPIPPSAKLPSCLLSLRIFLSLPSHRLSIFYRDASSAVLQLVNQWLDFTFSRFYAFRYVRRKKNSAFNKNRTHDFRSNKSKCVQIFL